MADFVAIYARLLGLVYLCAIGAFWNQVLGHAGAQGIEPVQTKLRAFRDDFPSWRRYFYLPTVLWFGAGDGALRVHVLIGIAGSIAALVGGGWVAWGGLFVCWVEYLSFFPALNLGFPWEVLLAEAGFLALWLPPIQYFGTNEWSFASAAAGLALCPPEHSWLAWHAHKVQPLVLWAMRWLFFRVMFGFGKLKFSDSTSRDHTYIKAFLVNQPIPNQMGWLLSKAPAAALKGGLIVMWIIEMALPWLAFVREWRALAALGTMALMVGIQAGGNFGFFNLLTAALCVPLFDLQASITDYTFGSGVAGTSLSLLHMALVGVYMLGGLVCLPLNNWVGLGWLHWPKLSFEPNRFWSFWRALQPWHLIHSYGVFPSHTIAPVRMVCVISGSNDGGKTWREYEYWYQPTQPGSSPAVVAPYHPRLDHWVYYLGMGNNGRDFSASLFLPRPYQFTHSTTMQRLLQRLLEGSPHVLSLFKSNPFPDTTPDLVKVDLQMLVPSPACGDHGVWWTRKHVSVYTPPTGLDKDGRVWGRWMQGPDTYHWDRLLWRELSPRFQRMVAPARLAIRQATELGAELPSLNSLVAATPGLTQADVTAFWDLLADLGCRGALSDWTALSSAAEALLDSRSTDQLKRLERVLLRMSHLLALRLAPGFWATYNAHKPSLNGRKGGWRAGPSEPHPAAADQQQDGDLWFPLLPHHTYFHLSLLIHAAALQGEWELEALWQHPRQNVHKYTDASADPDQSFHLYALFWWREAALMAQNCRTVQAITYAPPGDDSVDAIPGFARLRDWLATRTELSFGPETYPSLVPPPPGGVWTFADESH